jgi:hypothetical protein
MMTSDLGLRSPACMRLSIAHDRFGSSSHVLPNGNLTHPRDLDGPLRVAAPRTPSVSSAQHSKVGRVNGWQAQEIVFVGRTCGSVHVESFNKNMKALGVLESKYHLIRQKLVRRLLRSRTRCDGPT